MTKKGFLFEDMLKGGARDRAYVSDAGEVYIVKDFRLLRDHNPPVAVLDVDLVVNDVSATVPYRKRTGLPLSGKNAHLYDRKATRADIQKARFG